MGLVAGLCVGCGSSSTTSTANGGVVTLLSDYPYCNMLAFQTSFTEYRLYPVNGAVGSAISGFAVAPNIALNMNQLRDFSTIFNVAPFPPNTYDRVEVTIGLTQFSFFDPSFDPPFRNMSAGVANPKFTFPISPPLVVSPNKISGLHLEFDVRSSVSVDAQGQVTQDVKPVMRAVPITYSPTDGFGRVEDATGFVRNVLTSTSSTVPGTTGGFGLQTMGSNGLYMNVYVNSDTQFYGATSIDGLLTGTFAEVNGYIDSQGNFIARSVEFEGQEDASKDIMGIIGEVSSVTRDAGGNATGLQIFVREEDPEIQSVIPLDAAANVSFSDTTTYQYSSRFANFASLPFDPTALAPGQIVVVHGTASRATSISTQPTLAATAVYLKLQTVAGNFSALDSVGSDDKTGAFTMEPCADIFQAAPVLVITNNQTLYTNVVGLSALTPQPSLLVKGLLFYERQAQTINGITVPAGTLVMLASGVHQLD